MFYCVLLVHEYENLVLVQFLNPLIYLYDNKSGNAGLIHALKDHVADHHAESEVVAECVLLGVHDGRAVENNLATVLVVPLQGH